MDFTQLLASALFWPSYQTANPKTTPRDVQTISRAVGQMDSSPPMVRINERPFVKGGADAYFNPAKPDETWIYRNAPRFQSGDPTSIAGVLTHEGAHASGAGELQAREKEIEFIQRAIAGGYGNHKLLKQLESQAGQLRDPASPLATHYKSQQK